MGFNTENRERERERERDWGLGSNFAQLLLE